MKELLHPVYFKKILKIIINLKNAYIFLYLFFSYLLLDIILTYIPFNTDVGFLIIKQEEILIPIYKTAFFVHVYTSMLVIPAGLTQFSSFILTKHRLIHNVSGWIYAVVVVFISGPAGFIMAFYAEGGIISRFSFILLSLLWILFTSYAIIRIIKGDVKKHREFLIRSFSLTLSAITLRGWKYILALFLDIRPNDLYMIIAWLGWMPNLLVAEYIILRNNNLKNNFPII